MFWYLGNINLVTKTFHLWHYHLGDASIFKYIVTQFTNNIIDLV